MTPRLFLTILSMQARRLMSYRADFWITSCIGFIAQFGVIYFLWQAIYREAGTKVAGFTFEAMLLYYVLAILIGKLVRGGEAESNLSGEIYDGSLTRYMLYPVDYFHYKFAQKLGDMVPAFMQLAIFGIGFGVFFGIPADVPISWQGVLLAVPAIMLGNVLQFYLLAPVEQVAFWADNVWSLNVMVRLSVNLLGGVMFPLTLYPELAVPILKLLPFYGVGAFPVDIILGRVGAAEAFLLMGVQGLWIGFAVVLARVVWRRGTLQYAGVGI